MRLAACRCLRGISRSPSRTSAMKAQTSFVITKRLLRLGALGGSGEKSSTAKYLATESRDTPNFSATSLPETPSRSRRLISSTSWHGYRHFCSVPLRPSASKQLVDEELYLGTGGAMPYHTTKEKTHTHHQPKWQDSSLQHGRKNPAERPT